MPQRWNKAPDPKLYRAAVRETFVALRNSRGVKNAYMKLASLVSTDGMRSRCKILAGNTVETIFAEVEFNGSTDDNPITVTARVAAGGRWDMADTTHPPGTDVVGAARATLDLAMTRLTSGEVAS